MSAWTWVLVGLCAAGVLFPIIPLVVVLRLALRLSSRVRDLQHSRLMTSIESLQLQRAHLESIAAKAAPLAQRSQAAIETIGSSTSGYLEVREALRSTGEEISELVTTLR